MFSANHQSRYGTIIRIALLICFICLLMFLLVVPQTLAHATYPLNRGPRIKTIDAGLGGMYRDGNWVPIHISLENNGPDFDGRIALNFPSTLNTPGAVIPSKTTYQQALSLPSLSNKQVTMYVPVTSGIQGYNQHFTANLLDSKDHNVASLSSTLQSLNNNTVLIGLVTANPSLDTTLLVASLNPLHIAIQLQIVKPEQFPTRAAVLNNFDMLVLDNLTGSSFTHEQIASLQSWVNQGGQLVIVGGPEWHATFGQLPSALLPVTVTGNDNVPAGTHLLPVESQSSTNSGGDDTIANAVAVSVATVHSGTSTLLSSGSIPLIVQTNEGQGLVYYLAFDPFLSPLVNWGGISRLWEELITRSLGDKLLTLNSASGASGLPWKAALYGNMDSFLHVLIPNLLPPIWLILVLLFSYVLILGPIRLCIVRRSQKRQWTPRIVLSTIVIFSVFSYGLVAQVKETSIVNSRISVIQVNWPDSTGSAEHITDYVGMFVSSQGDFQMHMPAANLVQPINPIANLYSTAYTSRSLSGRHQTTITSLANETAVDLQGVSLWTLRTLVSQYDTHTAGGLTSHLLLKSQPKNSITGTVTNTLPYTLNDAYLLIGENFAPLGTLAPRQTKPVTLVLNASLNTSNQLLLADRIAASHGLSIATLSNTSNLNTLQRHVYMLGSLSNDCGTGLCPDGPTGSGMQTARQDPLLLSGASATLIGWASSQATETNAVTIGGTTSPQIQEAFIQAPLPINVSGTVTIPASLISSQIANIQVTDGNLQGYSSPSPGTYCMTTGSMTFELTLPTKAQLQNSSLDFTEEQFPVGGVGSCTSGAANTVMQLHTKLYNWQSKIWDEKSFDTYELNVDNAQPYIGPGGRILIQFDNQDSSLGPIIFTTPAVEVNGTT